MKALDRLLQRWRIAKARPYIARGARVLDVGCADGVLFSHLESEISELVGIDPNLPQSIETTRCRFISGRFPDSLADDGPFDAITMLAVLEHIPAVEQSRWAPACARLLKPGGFLIITAPSPVVDKILAIMKALRLIDGMSLEEHYGFEPHRVPSLFANGSLELVKAGRFQLGCNNLFVFRRALEGMNAET
jgi:2-polyprenyl-3-methyl-5-hydroxy-6-metoxy-1,4-benzoquinol methylase